MRETDSAENLTGERCLEHFSGSNKIVRAAVPRRRDAWRSLIELHSVVYAVT